MPTNQLLLIVAVLLFGFFVLRPILFGGPRVSASDAQARVRSGAAVLVDVRESTEWNTGVAAPAALLPLSDLRGPRSKWTAFLNKHRGKEIILYCASGMRSGAAAMMLKKEGFAVANLGGFSSWSGAGLPVRKP